MTRPHLPRRHQSLVYLQLPTSLLLSLVAPLLFIACSSGAPAPTPSPEPSRTPAPARGGPFGPGVTETEIRLGMTNDLAAVGDTPFGAITTAVQAYLRKTNEENGGVCGRQLVLAAEDDQHKSELALEKTKKLVEQDKVLAMIGGIDIPTHSPVAAYLNDPNADGNSSDGVPDLFVASGWSAWGDAARFPWTIAFVPDYGSEARIQARYVNEQLAGKKVGVLYESDDLGNDYLAGLKTTLANPALLVSEQPYDPSSTDLKAGVVALRDAGAEVVLLALAAHPTAQAMTLARAEGYAPRWLINYVNSSSALAREIGGGVRPEQLALGLDLLKGSISMKYVLSPVDDENAPPMVEHLRIMQTYKGPGVSTLSVLGQSLAEQVVLTLGRACDNLTRDGVLRAAESVRGFRSSLLTPGIAINLGPQDHHAIQALQPVQIQADGTTTALGSPISLEQ